MHTVDLRSDTVTRPTQAMRAAMASAAVGDDVFGDDPTVNALQEEVARRLGKEAALFVPSGTMANLVALRTLSEPGEEVILEASSHIYTYEAAGYAAVAGLSVALVHGTHGLMSVEGVARAIRPGSGLSHFPPTRLVVIENTSNRGGGTIYDLARIAGIAKLAREHGLRLHLDGARVWNAAVALGIPPAEIARPFDTVSCCLSKGLGCPAGSLIAGSRELIARAHRIRKMLGGGMRQAGVLAACGLHALDHHVERLADDHARAQRLGIALAACPGLGVELERLQTNMVYVDVTQSGRDAATWRAALAERAVLVVPTGPMTLRLVTHLDLGDADIDATIAAFHALAVA